MPVTAFIDGASGPDFLTQARAYEFQWLLQFVRLLRTRAFIVRPRQRLFLKLAISVFLETLVMETLDYHCPPPNYGS